MEPKTIQRKNPFPLKLYRKGLFHDPDRLTGQDSFQGVLEFLDRDYDHAAPIVFDSQPDQYSNRCWRRIEELVAEGYATIKHHEKDINDRTVHVIEWSELTLKGALLMDELRSKNAKARFRAKLGDLLWVVVTSILTTIVTLKLSGK